MKRFGYLVLCSGIVFLSAAGHAQNSLDTGASGLAGCGCCSTIIAIPIAVLVLNIALLVWVARDAKARGMDGAIGWVILVLLTSFVGLIIYIFARPQGNLIPCPNCGNSRLQASVKCPHCGTGG